MKKLFFVLCLIVVSMMSSFAQEDVATYSMLGLEMKVSASIDSKKQLSVFFDVMGSLKSDKVNVSLDGNNVLNQFRASLKQIEEKYVEWKNVAIENNVTKVTKEINVKVPNVTIAWYGTKWYFDFSEKLIPYFLVMNNEDDVLEYSVAMTGEATASSNRYITQKYYIIFNDVEEIESLYNALDPEAIISKLNGKRDTDSLFQ